MTCFRRELKPAPSSVTPPIGSNNKARVPAGLDAEFAVVLTVSVEMPPDSALNEQAGAGVPPPVMELQLRVTLPVKPFVGVMVMVEVADAPGATVAGERAVAAIVKPGVVFAVTIRVTVAVLTIAPAVPVTVTVEVPTGVVLASVEIVRASGVDVPGVTGLGGLNPQAAPVGRPEQVRVTGLLKPFTAASVRLYAAWLPAGTVWLVGASAVRVKLGAADPALKETDWITQFPPCNTVVASQLPVADVI